MNTLELARLKQHLLQEIEELDELNMPGPDDGYPLSEPKITKGAKYDPWIQYEYFYENDNQIDMEITITSIVFGYGYDTKIAAKGLKSLQISFGVAIDYMDEKGYKKTINKLQKVAANKKSDLISKASPDVVDLKYFASTGANDFLKVLATVVNATKDVMKREGGEDKIRDIRFSSSDKRRANVYDHYISSLFPKFVKRDSGDNDEYTYINKKYLQNK